MMNVPNLTIRLDQTDYDELEQFKNDRGLTWEGVLKWGVMHECE